MLLQTHWMKNVARKEGAICNVKADIYRERRLDREEMPN